MNSNYLKSLRIVYFALAMGIVAFMLLTLFLNKLNGPFSETDLSQAERIPFFIVIVVLTAASFMVYKAVVPGKLKTIQELPSLDRKLAAWRELSILQGALIEAPAFFALVLFLLLGEYTLLIWPVAGLALFWFRQPTRESLIREAKLSSNEIAEFDKSE